MTKEEIKARIELLENEILANEDEINSMEYEIVRLKPILQELEKS